MECRAQMPFHSANAAYSLELVDLFVSTCSVNLKQNTFRFKLGILLLHAPRYREKPLRANPSNQIILYINRLKPNSGTTRRAERKTPECRL